ncbi:hypothetical protein [Pararhizobium antarcticum]|uniref:hypothetical protein n=1 Tax=Pararhizobium antarcticum TaxID=1798805 RepID=UPI001114B757|nr:hypothetical protein [Pararhizobium antarcticum]
MFILSVGRHPVFCFMRMSGMPGIVLPVWADSPTLSRRKSTGIRRKTPKLHAVAAFTPFRRKIASMCCRG